MTVGITAPILALDGIASKMAYDFNQQMELLRTSAGIPQSAIAGLSDQVLKMSGQVGQAPEALAQGLYHIASAGNGIWSTAQMMDILKTASEGANMGMASLDSTTYALTSAMASGVKGAKDANDMMAILNATVGAGDMKMEDLNGALSTGLLSTAATFGISIQSVGSALATLTDNGEHADEAATRLRMTIALMSSPSSMAAKQLQALGLTAEDAKNATSSMNKVFAESGLTTTKLADDLRKPNGIAVAVEDLKTHLENAGLSASEADAMLSKAFGGGRSDAALMTMLQNTGRMDDKFKAINDSAGQFQSKLDDLNNTPQMKIQKAWDSIQADLTSIGEKLLPGVADATKNVADDISGLVDWFNKLDPATKAGLGYAVEALALGGPILLGMAGIIKLGKEVKDAFDLAKDGVELLGKGIGGVIGIAGKLGSAAADTGGSWISKAADVASAWGSKFVEITKTVITEGPKIALKAIDTAAAWILNAIRIGIVWTEQFVVMVAKGAWAAAQATPQAIAASAVWVKNAAVASFAWVTTELPKIVIGFVTTSAAATVNAAVSSAAWVKNAAVSSVAWVVTELPKIVTAFVVTAAASAVNAAAAAASWVASGVTATATWTAFQALIATPLVMPAIAVAAAIASIMLVYNAVQAVIGALNAMNSAAAANASSDQASAQLRASAKSALAAGRISQAQYNQDMALANQPDQHSAWWQTALTGKSYSVGGYTGSGGVNEVAGVVHKGEYVLPQSAVDQTTGRPKAGVTGGASVHIDQVTISNNMDEQKFLKDLGWRLSIA
jgi:hypothetical protein